uniref:Norrin cystine knot growth factor NDP n=1 Tax=Eptatretus burgeri TaxID=7764 RepID=A0A8C4WYR5_EPTBU
MTRREEISRFRSPNLKSLQGNLRRTKLFIWADLISLNNRSHILEAWSSSVIGTSTSVQLEFGRLYHRCPDPGMLWFRDPSLLFWLLFLARENLWKAAGGEVCRKGRVERCVREHYVRRISHPMLNCHSQPVLLARCRGHCGHESAAEPVISFGRMLPEPFHLACRTCRPQQSRLKAVTLRCVHGRARYGAIYPYILSCSCAGCH